MRRSGARAAGAQPQCLFMGGDFPRKGGFDLLDAWAEGGFDEPRRSDAGHRMGRPRAAPAGRAAPRKHSRRTAGVARRAGATPTCS